MRTILIFLILFLCFLYGTIVGRYEYPPFHLIKKIKRLITPVSGLTPEISLQNSSLSHFNTCNLSQTSSLDSNFSVFIGHAYGSHSSTAESFLSLNVENFIQENSSKLNTLVFTGDVFSVPSIAKWNK